jgi:hypothetical protein
MSKKKILKKSLVFFKCLVVCKSAIRLCPMTTTCSEIDISFEDLYMGQRTPGVKTSVREDLLVGTASYDQYYQSIESLLSADGKCMKVIRYRDSIIGISELFKPSEELKSPKSDSDILQ